MTYLVIYVLTIAFLQTGPETMGQATMQIPFTTGAQCEAMKDRISEDAEKHMMENQEAFWSTYTNAELLVRAQSFCREGP